MTRYLASAVVVFALVACSTPSQLAIELFDISTDGLSLEPAPSSHGEVVVADSGFRGEPLVTITEGDITSWDKELRVIRLVPSKASEIALAALRTESTAAGAEPRLLFRLSINDASVWGFITWYPTAPVPGLPYLMFPGGLAGSLDHPEEFGVVQLASSGGVMVRGADLWNAAWKAWAG